MIKAHGYATHSPTSKLGPFHFERREAGAHDVVINILYCGICHSDIHQARDEWGGSIYPMVPGHEIVGKVTQIGNKVTNFKIGDTVGVGCMVDSCQTCHNCHASQEQFCEKGSSVTYNGYEQDGKTPTFGGYSDCIVTNEKFVLHISSEVDLARTAPLLCAGITTYSPLKRWKAGPGKKVGIIGIGGLGHVAIKIARAMGATVIVFTTSQSKCQDALNLGAHEVVLSTDAEQMAKYASSLDLIIDAVSAKHDINKLLHLVKLDGAMVMLGLPEEALPLNIGELLFTRRILTGSLIGGIAETQEMLDFCAKHNILADIEKIPMSYVNEAYERILKSDVKYRFVIDMSL